MSRISPLSFRSDESTVHNKLQGKLYISSKLNSITHTCPCIQTLRTQWSVGQGVQGCFPVQPGEWRLASRRVDPEIQLHGHWLDWCTQPLHWISSLFCCTFSKLLSCAVRNSQKSKIIKGLFLISSVFLTNLCGLITR